MVGAVSLLDVEKVLCTRTRLASASDVPTGSPEAITSLISLVVC